MGTNNKIFERIDEMFRKALILEMKLLAKGDDSHNMQVGNVEEGINKRVKLLETNKNNSPLFNRNILRNFNFELVQVNSID